MQIHVTRSGIGGVYGHPVTRCDARLLPGYDPADGTASCGEQFDPNRED